MLDIEDVRDNVTNKIYNHLSHTEMRLYNELHRHKPYTRSTRGNLRTLACTDVQAVVQRTVLSVPELNLYNCFEVDQFA